MTTPPRADPPAAPLDIDGVKRKLEASQKQLAAQRHIFGDIMNPPTLKLLDTIDGQNSVIAALVAEVERLRSENLKIKGILGNFMVYDDPYSGGH